MNTTSRSRFRCHEIFSFLNVLLVPRHCPSWIRTSRLVSVLLVIWPLILKSYFVCSTVVNLSWAVTEAFLVSSKRFITEVSQIEKTENDIPTQNDTVLFHKVQDSPA